MRGGLNIGAIMNEIASHWSEIHKNKDKEVSWWQEILWLDFLDYLTPTGAAIDVGSGQSPMAIELAKSGFDPVFVNDIAENALSKLTQLAKESGVDLIPIAGSVLELKLPTPVSLWHDRAVFHFLSGAEVDKFKEAVISNTAPDAFLVIATFSENGPDQCSNLDVSKYSPSELAGVFSPEFKEVFSNKRIHTTPWNSTQEFSFVILQKQNFA